MNASTPALRAAGPYAAAELARAAWASDIDYCARLRAALLACEPLAD